MPSVHIDIGSFFGKMQTPSGTQHLVNPQVRSCSVLQSPSESQEASAIETPETPSKEWEEDEVMRGHLSCCRSLREWEEEGKVSPSSHTLVKE